MASASSAEPILAERERVSAIRVVDLRKRFKAFGSFDSSHTSSLSAASRYLGKLTGRGGGRFTALDGVNLEVRDGEVFGLLGPNGAGKTTLIKILSTLVLPDSGSTFICGVDVVKNPRAALKKVQSVMAGNTGFDVRLTGRQNLEFSADLYGIPREAAKVKIDELLHFSQLEAFSGEMLQKYSTGMTRKLLVCRALLSEAQVLLFDEPTANLDPVAAAEFRTYIKNDLARARGRTILLATHNLWEAEQICDRIALLRKGKVILTGTPDEIRSKVAEGVNLSLTIVNGMGGSAAKLLEGIRSVDGVVNVQFDPDSANGQSRIRVEGMKELDYNSLFQKVMSMNFQIRSIETSQVSLEQAFLKLNEEAAN
jgi:ABC-2 type transport system ATP-binding protein